MQLAMGFFFFFPLVTLALSGPEEALIVVW